MSDVPSSEIVYDPPAEERVEVSELVHSALKQQVFGGHEVLRAMITLPSIASILECTRLRIRKTEGEKKIVFKVELPVHDVSHQGEKLSASLLIEGEFDFAQ